MQSTLNFEEISKKLEALAENQPGRRSGKTIELLDKIRPALLQARERKVPFKTLAVFLKENGIAVGATTLRLYFNTLSGGKKASRKRKKNTNAHRRKSTFRAADGN